MPKLIKNWDELVGLHNDNYYLEIDVDKCYGYIKSYSNEIFFRYLSTHTFYGKSYQDYTIMLQEFGFDVQLKNWDGYTEYVDVSQQWLYSGKCDICFKRETCEKKCEKYIKSKINNSFEKFQDKCLKIQKELKLSLRKFNLIR